MKSGLLEGITIYTKKSDFGAKHQISQEAIRCGNKQLCLAGKNKVWLEATRFSSKEGIRFGRMEPGLAE
jgi:hypothetical protein